MFQIKDNNQNKIPLEQRRWTCRNLIEVACNFCGHAKGRCLAVENGLAIMECSDCGLVYVNPQPTDQELNAFYQQYLVQEVSDDWAAATTPLFMTDMHRIKKYKSPGRLLDIGCGFGFFLDLMQKQGWEVFGQDLSDIAVKFAHEELGLSKVQYGPFLTANFQKSGFDVISAWYVLHHLSQPAEALAKMHKLLKPGGLLVIRVPNHHFFKLIWTFKKYDSKLLQTMVKLIRKDTADECVPFNVLDPPVHLFAFTPAVLTTFIEKNGFKVVRIYNDGMVSRGNLFNRIFDRSITLAADFIKLVSRNRIDLSISFSIYACKKPAKIS